MSSDDVCVALVHGALAHGSSWAKIIAPLAADGIKAVAAPLLENQRFMAERRKARVHAHPVDHAPLVTASSMVLDIIRGATGHVVAG